MSWNTTGYTIDDIAQTAAKFDTPSDAEEPPPAEDVKLRQEREDYQPDEWVRHRVNAFHAEELKDGSGLSDETIHANGLYTETSVVALKSKLNKQYRRSCGPALVFPYLNAAKGRFSDYERVKPQRPANYGASKGPKYESPKGERTRIYFPAGVIQHLQSDCELFVTEGEKKALKMTQEGFPTIGIPGVWNWGKGKGNVDELSGDFQSVKLRGRRVLIVFDSDQNEKDQVMHAQARLWKALEAAGALVFIVQLPDGENGEKIGADDYLVARSGAEFRKLADDAAEAEEVFDNFEVSKIAGREMDFGQYARTFLDKTCPHPVRQTLANYRDEWFWYTGRHWRATRDGDIRGKLTQWLDQYVRGLAKSHISSTLEHVKAQSLVEGHNEHPVWLGSGSREYIACKNGLLDLNRALAGESDAMVEHSPDWFSQSYLPYEYQPGAECPKWFNMLHQNLEGDDQRIDLLQQWCGYCLTKSTDHQKFLMLVGEGGNGKSVVLGGITALLGRDNVSTVPLEDFGERFTLQRTVGKLANIAAEVGPMDRVAEGKLKEFTAGDRMQFERKHRDPFETTPTAKLMLSTNNLPRFSDRSGGLWRRMLLMPFEREVPANERIVGMDKPDYWLNQGELPGMLNWAIDGLRRLQESGQFTQSAVCEQALAAYRVENNPARTFLLDRFTLHPGGAIPSKTVFQEYRQFCIDGNYRALAEREFGKEVYRAFSGVEKVRIREGHERHYTYKNLIRGSI